MEAIATFVPGTKRAYRMEQDGGGAFWTDRVDGILADCETIAEQENRSFDRNSIKKLLLQMKEDDEPFRLSEWSVTVHYVSEDWLRSLPEFDGW